MVIRLPSLCGGKLLIAIDIASSSAVYVFCSARGPRLSEKVVGSSFAAPTAVLVESMATPIPTVPLLSDEHVAIRTPWLLFANSAALALSGSMTVGRRASHGLTTNGRMISILSVDVRRCAWAIFCSGETNLRNALKLSLESGCVFGSVWMLIHSLVVLSMWRSRTVRMLASASATAVATVRKQPVIACAPILCTLFRDAVAAVPHACIHTFDA